MSKIDLHEKLALFDDLWSPRIVAQSNGQLVKLAKGSGELVWHVHEQEDELFLVLKGQLTIKLRDGEVVLLPGDLFVVPKGVEHCPVAEPDTHFMLIEPKTTQHTGRQQVEQTVAVDQQPWI
ncbi:cupin domain-containing protein [bacterium SCSIO 12696]|nr:cupin domain-containing protein [bacterium SCSIO 12696]